MYCIQLTDTASSVELMEGLLLQISEGLALNWTRGRLNLPYAYMLPNKVPLLRRSWEADMI